MRGQSATTDCSSVSSSSPIVGSHVYSVVNAFKDAAGAIYYTVRNPWGNDGGPAVTDSNYGDGLITLSASAFASNFYTVVYGV